MASSDRIQMAVDTQDESPLFIMGCLSPSRDEAEPPTKIFDVVESPKCATLLAFSRDEEEEEQVEESIQAASVGLMATGLAWVRRQQKSPRYATATSPPNSPTSSGLYESRYPIEQQLKERLEQQKREDRLQRTRAASPPYHHSTQLLPSTPTNSGSSSRTSPPPQIDTNTSNSQDLDEQPQIQSCPTSPSFMSRVYTNLAKIPLASNNSISNSENNNSNDNNNQDSTTSSTPVRKVTIATQTESQSESSPTTPQQRTQLTPRLNPVNNIYSFSNLMSSTATTAITNTPATTPTACERNKKNLLQQQDDETVPRSFFCQEPTTSKKKKNKSKSPTRSTLIQVWAKIGSDYEPSSSSSSSTSSADDEDDDDSILEADEDDDEDDDYDEYEDDIHGISWIPPVRCVAEGGGDDQEESISSRILTPQQMHQIARYVLPKGIASCQWKRLYSLVRDGDSFEVCLHYAQRDARTLLLIRTTRGAIMGGYASEVWQTKSEGYYGKSDTCLFTFEEKVDDTCCCENVDPLASNATTPTNGSSVIIKTPTRPNNRSSNTTTTVAPLTPQSPPLVHRPKKSLLDEDNYEASLPPIRVYRYTGVNRYIQYCDANKQRMAFGGGGEEGSFGLCVEQEFQSGSTGPCDTFDNEPLCDQENFNIVDVELWGFLAGHF